MTEEPLSEADQKTLRRVLARPCGFCGATVDEWCRTATGTLLDHLDAQHLTRRLSRAKPTPLIRGTRQ
ncbi:hypothetical protein [Actinopolymorpha alba]|uniref:zinc finger domain-containing protein n=1 Tax=Actinopolymorpha alba TaxID=533267 RepID=UPI0003764BDB|nr:hypothetical protein [Actinopolymorpha alba]